MSPVSHVDIFHQLQKNFRLVISALNLPLLQSFLFFASVILNRLVSANRIRGFFHHFPRTKREIKDSKTATLINKNNATGTG